MEALTSSPHPIVRDLAWVIGSPPLLDISENLFSYEETQAEYAQHYAWLEQLSANPTLLQAHLKRMKRQTLGSHFESLVSFWLMHRPDTRLRATNLQVQEQHRTLGEMDIIVDIGTITTHLETAVKFYLGEGNRQEWQHWLGPAARDRLDIKMHTLLSRQLLLPKSPAGQALLAEQQLTPHSSRLFLKGYFFSPYPAFIQHNATFPTTAHPRHHHGWWCREHDIKILLEESASSFHYTLLPRFRWLAPAYAAKEETLYTRKTLLPVLESHFTAPSTTGTPLLIAALTESTSGWHEQHRGFIVPDSWPHHI